MISISDYEDIATRVKYVDGDLIWVNCTNKSLNGTVAGKPDNYGYLRIHFRTHGMMAVHRLIFFMHYKYLPRTVDHIDGNNRNNRIENLRAASVAENMMNSKTPITNTSGRKGVYFHKPTGKWSAGIRVDSKQMHLGIFERFEDAVAARKQAEEKYHGEFARG